MKSAPDHPPVAARVKPHRLTRLALPAIALLGCTAAQAGLIVTLARGAMQAENAGSASVQVFLDTGGGSRAVFTRTSRHEFKTSVDLRTVGTGGLQARFAFDRLGAGGAKLLSSTLASPDIDVIFTLDPGNYRVSALAPADSLDGARAADGRQALLACRRVPSNAALFAL